MRRDAHPAHGRSQVLSTHGPAAAGALAALALALATGALRSPFLLILPLAALPLLIRVARSAARRILGFGTLALLVGQAAGGGLDALTAAAALIGAGALELAAAHLRRPGPTATRALEGATDATSAAPAEPIRELHVLLERTRGWTGAPAMTVWQCADGTAQPVAAAGRAPPAPRPLAGDPLGWVAREGTPLWFAPTPPWSEPGASVAALRLRGGGSDAWLVTTEFTVAQGRPALEDLDVACGGLRLFVDVLADRQRTLDDQLRFQRLIVLLRRIPIAVEPEAFGSELLTAALSLTGATGGTLGSWLDDAGAVIGTVGADGGPARGQRFLAPDSELALAVRAGTRIDRVDAEWRPGRTHVANENDRWTARPRALTCLPLLTATGTVGALALWSSRAPRLDGDGLDLLQAVLPYAALHLEHSAEFGRLRERADHDALTGLRNRRAFEAAFLAERQRFERYGHPIALLILDIDHFKAINDEHGHEAGDEVLRATAALLRTAVRDVDIPARFGGEEFVVLLPETPLAAARDVAERVRATVAAKPVIAAGHEVAVRVSVGVSACPEIVAAAGELLGSADTALYEAKRGGRNQVVTAATAARGIPHAPSDRAPHG
ncbi:MAG TPA: GGDEF domain-containing protein [Longimicrobiales bacterium]|nr:GGDEF domain-containing protein [Longimicrobiales bacterium]